MLSLPSASQSVPPASPIAPCNAIIRAAESEFTIPSAPQNISTCPSSEIGDLGVHSLTPGDLEPEVVQEFVQKLAEGSLQLPAEAGVSAEATGA